MLIIMKVKMLITKSTKPSPSTTTSKCTILSAFCLLSLLTTQLMHLQTATSIKLNISSSSSVRQIDSAKIAVVEGYEKNSAYDELSGLSSSSLTSETVATNATFIEQTAATSTSRNTTVDQTGTKAINGELTKVADQIDHDEVGDSDNTTLLIDYDQQGYSLSASTPATTMVQPATATTTTIRKQEESRRDSTGKLVEGKPSSLNTRSDHPVETIGQASSNQESRRRAESRQLRSSSNSDNGSSSSTRSTSGDGKLAASELGVDDQYQDVTMRSRVDSARGLRDARLSDKLNLNATNIFKTLLKKKPYSKYWSVEQKWDDIFRRFLAVQNSVKDVMLKNFLRDIAYYADVSISQACSEDLKFVQEYAKKSTNFRWLAHMFDSTGKNEPGLLTGNLASLGHVIQCIKVRAPAQPSNHTFDEQFFQAQTELLGERFRGKYCLASLRPVLPEKPRLVSRFSNVLDEWLISNISYTGESVDQLKQRAGEMSIPEEVYNSIDRKHHRLDQVPFESELYQFLINQRNFMFSLPRFMGVCYPSSCTKDDIRYSLQKTMDDQHQVVDIEFDCEVEETKAWSWFNTPRLIIYVFLILVAVIIFCASLMRYILVDKLGFKRRSDLNGHKLANLIQVLDLLSMDKCAGILFVKTKQASPIIDATKMENNRSTSIDALKGLLILILVYSELIHLGCLPVPFMWSKWGDAMFPFFRSAATQPFLNTSIWTEAFYVISAYLIGLKVLENNRTSGGEQEEKSTSGGASRRWPSLATYASKRYVRLVLPMVCFMILNYVWPRLSNGFVMQDQANKILKPCDAHGWTNLLLLHNHYALNETCLWPTHVSASFFQLHLLSYPILLLLLFSLRTRFNAVGMRKLSHKVVTYLTLALIALLALFGIVYPALMASQQELIVPFLIDYIDFDNYRRVIEWTVLPTHNHLTSYMMGILLAYLVAKKRADREVREASLLMSSEVADDWQGAYIQRGSSTDSVNSNSTQGLQCRPVFGSSARQECQSTSSRQASREDLSKIGGGGGAMGRGRRDTFARQMSSALISAFMLLATFITLTSSWYWNGLGQPMSADQTFWFMCLTKLVFTVSFSYIFYKYLATRRNSNDPWMITRFLVPIGRMSLTVFYMSWLVIWFDLLSSLYQWHPSHYFVFEKFNEIIFITLVLALFAYGSFEGTVKILQYSRRAEKLGKLPSPATESWSSSSSSSSSNTQGFDALFKPPPTIPDGKQGSSGDRQSGEMFGNKSAIVITPSNSSYAISREQAGALDNNNKSNSLTAQHLNLHGSGNKRSASYLSPSGGGKVTSGGGGSGRGEGRHLSIAEQYKLNAELRANYSFASIGLYESAGATDDLNQSSHSSDPQGSRDRR